MINNKKVLAIVTARKGSKGLPGKNIMSICGKPLIAWTIEQGLSSCYIDKLIVSTDCEEIASIAESCGASVPFLRPAELASDSASSIDVVFHAIKYLEKNDDYYDLVVLLEPTSPLRQTTDIDGAIHLCDSIGDYSSVVGVAKAESGHPAFLFKLESNYLKPITGRYPIGLRRQDLEEPYFFLEGSVYVSSVSSLYQNKSFYHDSTIPWIVDRYKALEIDELADFIMVEALLLAKLGGRLNE
jgi:N-acylneuraminate cytidylyltransferase/CMP-N,N'-diacetyllegionaminic acid synthase